jgi:hypothetical protein
VTKGFQQLGRQVGCGETLRMDVPKRRSGQHSYA